MTDVVIADDHTVFVEALDTVLTQYGFTVAAVATSLAAVVPTVRKHRPAVCLLDRHFAEGDAMGLIGEIRGLGTRTGVVLVTADPAREAVTEALASGARGYVHKTHGVTALADAIRRVAAGEVVVDSPIARVGPTSPDAAHARRLAAYLTPRERQCLGMLVEGLATQEMVERLGVSTVTVRTHVQAVLTKLGVHSRLEAVAHATQRGLLKR